MEAVTMLRERRSVRSFRDEKVDINILNEIISTATYSPTWANSQTVRYTVIDGRDTMDRLGKEGLKGFALNIKALSSAAGVVVVSTVNGKSGRSADGSYINKEGDSWEMFDAGAACQTFCLAAYEKGIGTVIQGVFDEDRVAEVIDLPDNETVVAVIPYGYEDKHPQTPRRKEVEEVTRYIHE